MTDLSKFGGGLDEPETDVDGDDQDQANSTGREFHAGRCRAIKLSSGERCRGDTTGPMATAELCSHHAHDQDPLTIGGDPVELIEATAGLLRSQFDEHLDAWDRLKPALHGAVGLEDEPLTVSADGLWLPMRHRRAPRLIVRTPTKTCDSRISTDREGPPCRDAVSGLAYPLDWDEDYLAGEGRTAEIRNDECLAENHDDGRPRVGLLIQGEPQEWYPVEIVDDGGADD